jgi:hypothetical protein
MKVFWVSKRLAFGGASAISTWDRIRRLHEDGFTHVINLRSSRRYRSKLRSFHSLWLPFPDDKKERPGSIAVPFASTRERRMEAMARFL